MIKRQHIWKQIKPTATTIVLLWLSLGALSLGVSLAIAFAAVGDMEDPWGTGAFVYGCLSSPMAVVLLGVAAWREKRQAARALLLMAMALLFSVALAVVALAMGRDPDIGYGQSLGFYALCCGPMSLISFVPALLVGYKVWPGLRRDLRSAHERAAITLIRQRGRISLQELADELGMAVSDVESMLATLILSDRLEAIVYSNERLVFEQSVLEAERQRLVSVLRLQGKAAIRDLARQFGVSADTIADWAAQLVDKGQFSGYVHWAEGILYSAEAVQLSSDGRCPHCGGPLDLAGKGLLHCPACGSEIFMANSASSWPPPDVEA